MKTTHPYIIFLVAWLREEVMELETATTPEQRIDALFDILGLILGALGCLSTRALTAGRYEYHLAQLRRDRTLTFWHSLIDTISAELTRADSEVNPYSRFAEFAQMIEAKAGSNLIPDRSSDRARDLISDWVSPSPVGEGATNA
uniref:Uncharacterized protein n=1 Tax=viral metagenome TaxID=1070528 RepID=A0A2V0RAL5_9ZZZZ